MSWGASIRSWDDALALAAILIGIPVLLVGLALLLRNGGMGDRG